MQNEFVPRTTMSFLGQSRKPEATFMFETPQKQPTQKQPTQKQPTQKQPSVTKLPQILPQKQLSQKQQPLKQHEFNDKQPAMKFPPISTEKDEQIDPRIMKEIKTICNREFENLRDLVDKFRKELEGVRNEVHMLRGMYSPLVHELANCTSRLQSISQSPTSEMNAFSLEKKRLKIIEERNRAHSMRFNTELFTESFQTPDSKIFNAPSSDSMFTAEIHKEQETEEQTEDAVEEQIEEQIEEETDYVEEQTENDVEEQTEEETEDDVEEREKEEKDEEKDEEKEEDEEETEK